MLVVCVLFAVVDDQGDIIVVATEAPSDDVDFTRSAQFLVGEMLRSLTTVLIAVLHCLYTDTNVAVLVFV